MIDISKIDSQTLELMKEISKSDKEYCIPLIDKYDSISAYDIIEGSESSVCAITPSLIPWMVAQFHNHPGEIKVLISDGDMIISDKFNIVKSPPPLIGEFASRLSEADEVGTLGGGIIGKYQNAEGR